MNLAGVECVPGLLLDSLSTGGLVLNSRDI